jgi:hypothetical protein
MYYKKCDRKYYKLGILYYVMIAKLFEIKETKNRGKGLFAKKLIPKGTIICFECNNDKIIPKLEFDKLSNKVKGEILEHAYIRKDGSVLNPCDETIYLNHSCNSNILDAGKGFDIIVKDIKKGEEATYDYRVFYEDRSFSMNCSCGENNCCRVIRCIHPVPKELKSFWNKKIKESLSLIKKVEQPLKKEILNQRKDIKDLFSSTSFH